MWPTILIGGSQNYNSDLYKKNIKLTVTLQWEYFLSSLFLQCLLFLLIVIMFTTILIVIIKTKMNNNQIQNSGQSGLQPYYSKKSTQKSSFKIISQKPSIIPPIRLNSRKRKSKLINNRQINSHQKSLKRKPIKFNNANDLIINYSRPQQQQIHCNQVEQPTFCRLSLKDKQNSVEQSNSQSSLTHSKRIEQQSQIKNKGLGEKQCEIYQHQQKLQNIFLRIEKKIYYLLCYLSLSILLVNIMKYGYICLFGTVIGVSFYMLDWKIEKMMIKSFFIGFIIPIVGIWIYGNMLY